MVYVKYCEPGYIIGVGYLTTDNQTGETITKSEYEYLRGILISRPSALEGFGYRLTKDLEWELYEVPVEEEPELSADEALEIILGGEV